MISAAGAGSGEALVFDPTDSMNKDSSADTSVAVSTSTMSEGPGGRRISTAFGFGLGMSSLSSSGSSTQISTFKEHQLLLDTGPTFQLERTRRFFPSSLLAFLNPAITSSNSITFFTKISFTAFKPLISRTTSGGNIFSSGRVETRSREADILPDLF